MVTDPLLSHTINAINTTAFALHLWPALSMSKKMSPKLATPYFLLLVLVLHVHHTSADNCIYTSPAMPFCKGWMCKSECWTEAKLIGATVQGRQCMKGGFNGWCSCHLCRN